MDDVFVRPACVGDLDQLLKFEQAIIETERPFDPTIRIGGNVHYYDLEELISSPNAIVMVAELGSEIIGSGYARIEDSKPYLTYRKYAYLGFMYVVPVHRGRGINKRIVAELEERSVSQGVSEMRLEVYAANVAALKAYEKSGYSPLLVEMRKG